MRMILQRTFFVTGVIIMKSVMRNGLRRHFPLSLAIIVSLVTAFQSCQSTALQTIATDTKTRWIADIPIEESLVVVSELGFSFDWPSGRIIVVFATSNQSKDVIWSYYRKTLPSLGWIGSGDLFQHASEEISIRQVRINEVELWRISLQPAL